MKRWIGPVLVLALTALAAHWATLQFAPSVIMDRALAALADRGVALHAFTNPARITPQTQIVVRTSPDLFYSLCRYDLSEPGSALEVTMGEWPDYQSLAFFDAETNNFHTLRATGKSAKVRLSGPGAQSADTFASPTERGVVLIRRLAPTQELFDAAKEVSKADACRLISS